MTSEREGLRERRRSQTQREIHAAALGLARRHGFDKVTVQMISDEAGVSPRTFFNYFPSKEAALIVPPPRLLTEDVAAFTAAGPASPGDLLVDLTVLLLREMAENPPRRDVVRATFSLALEHPAVLAVLLAGFEGFQQHLADTVAERIGEQPTAQTPRLIAALAMAAVKTGLESFAASDGAEDDSPLPFVERAVAALHTLLGR